VPSEVAHKAKRQSVSRNSNPNWGTPMRFGSVVPTVTSFEEVVKGLKLQPDQYVHSMRLRERARRNKDSKFIPESLLQAWGFEITKQPFISYSATVRWKLPIRRSG
jgi:hypothetical protein